jgi:hypothetical protein
MKILYKSFIKDPEHICYDGEDSNEKILYILRRSLYTNIGWTLVTALLIVAPFILTPHFIIETMGLKEIIRPQFYTIIYLFWYLLAFGYGFQNFLNWFFNAYIISTKKILDFDFHGLLYKNISEAPLTNVEDVTSTMGSIGV